MEGCMRENMRKLALWHTRTFKPIITHDDLDSIMATKGFISLPPSSSSSASTTLLWKEYVYYAARSKTKSSPSSSPPPPRPRLPYPTIDGLHIYTYRAFIDAVNFYLEMGDISDLFHVRGMPLHRINDRNRKWVRMQEDESNMFVYRDGTLDQTTEDFYESNNHSHDAYDDSMVIRERGINNNPVSFIVSLKDVIL